MQRPGPFRYNLQVAVTMAVYVALLALVWPLIRTAQGMPVKALLAILPVLPMLYVIGLMARRVMSGDELEQRTHLLALGVATAAVSALSLIGGFLAAGGVAKLDGGVLIWVFPVLMLVYGGARWWLVTRVYGGSFGMECDARDAFPWRWRILLLAGLMAFLALIAWWRGDHDDTLLGMLCGMGAALGVFLVVAAVRRLRGKAE